MAKELDLNINFISRVLIPTNPGMYITNVNNSKSSGTHWVATNIDFEKEAIYFDLFG